MQLKCANFPRDVRKLASIDLSLETNHNFFKESSLGPLGMTVAEADGEVNVMNTIEQTSYKPPLQPGAIWGLLQDERSEVCQALLEKSRPISDDTEAADESVREVEWRHCQNLQQCLHRIDDALDRLTEGNYGHCAKCGGPIAEARLEADPTASHCLACQRRSEGERAFPTM